MCEGRPGMERTKTASGRPLCRAGRAQSGIVREIKCVGMITPSRCQTLYKAFYRAKVAGSHGAITPAPTSFASELQGLLACKTMLENKYASKKIKDSFLQALPTHIHTALREWALVTREKVASPLDHNPH
eukprot:175971-Pelagomonas_calceolata.AAC.1